VKNKGGKVIPMVKWLVCTRKQQDGGLSIPHLDTYGLTLVSKRFLKATQGNELWKYIIRDKLGHPLVKGYKVLNIFFENVLLVVPFFFNPW
jgi:hypothetical protein